MKKTVNIRMPRILVGATLVAGMVAGSFVGLPTVSAASGEAVWDGDAGDLKFSTAANWEGDTLPKNGDVLVFNKKLPTSEHVVYQSDLNIGYGGLRTSMDESGSTPGSQVFNGEMKFNDNATIEGFGLILSNGIGTGNLQVTGGDVLQFESGTKVNGVSYWRKLTVQGILSVKGNSNIIYIADKVSASGYRIEGEASFRSYDQNVSTPITLAPSAQSSEAIGIDSFNGGKVVFDSVTLESNSKVSLYNEKTTLEIKNLIKNGYSLSRTKDSLGTLITPDGAQATEFEKKTTNLDGNKPNESVTVIRNETAILNGVRDYITIKGGGILKGNGSAGSIFLEEGAVISPGNSAGSITSTFSLYMLAGSVYSAELKNTQEYDKLIVTGINDVSSINIEGSILDLSLLPSASIKKGDTFTIIDNKASTGKTAGTFKDLPEGARIIVGDAVFSISYVGGDGNDVVLTALNDATMPAPGTPKTGVESLAQVNPAIVAGIAILAAAMLIFAKRRSLQR